MCVALFCVVCWVLIRGGLLLSTLVLIVGYWLSFVVCCVLFVVCSLVFRIMCVVVCGVSCVLCC